MKIFFMLVMSLVVLGSASKPSQAAQSDSGYSTDYAYVCATLDVFVAKWRKSFCDVYSPGANLDELDVQVHVFGEARWALGNPQDKPACDEPEGSPYAHTESDGYSELLGTTDHIEVGFLYNIESFNFLESMSAYGEWSYIVWTPPNDGGSGSVGPLVSSVGSCY